MKQSKKKTRFFVSKPQPSGKVLHYWQPTRKVIETGFLPRRLSDDPEIARQEAERFNRELDLWRKTPEDIEPPFDGTLSSVIAKYKKDPLFTEKAFSTQRVYSRCLDRIERWGGDQKVEDISRGAIIDFHRAVYAKKPAFANAIGRMLRIVLEYAYDLGLIDQNPARRLKMKSRPPRETVWTEEDIQAFITTATEVGRPSMALAVLIGVWTAQREGDILAMAWSRYDGVEMSLRQRKTGRWVQFPVAPDLKHALDNTPRKSPLIVVNETTGKPYRSDHFRHLFREIANTSGLKHLQFRDLRRTMIVRMAEAGDPTPQITAVSGHEDGYCNQILETYMPRNSQMADRAIGRLVEHRAQKKAPKKADDENET